MNRNLLDLLALEGALELNLRGALPGNYPDNTELNIALWPNQRQRLTILHSGGRFCVAGKIFSVAA